MSSGPQRVRVVEVVRETVDAHSLVLEPEDPQPFESYRPGQFLTVRIPSERAGGAARCYSLSSSPHCQERLKVTVKRTVGGYGSNWLCDNVAEGMTLEVLRPSGMFTPKSLDDDVLLLAGGSGITPVMSILKSVLGAGAGAVTLVYANRDEQSVIFRDELVTLAKEHPDRLVVLHWLESLQGIPTAAGLRALTGPYTGRQVYICGPGPFMDLAQATLAAAGVPDSRLHIERFTSLTNDPFADVDVVELDVEDDDVGPPAEVEVQLDGEVTTVAWPRRTKLLDALRNAGLDAPFSCREGNCSACACVVLEGEAAMERNEVLDAHDLEDGLLLACQAFPISERFRITYEA
ncbi:ferredoxin--NADP reductase [Geodermatophilus marinus]|uniref:ferredoxin--NADP reductase n=1 Tax=Geodermatophilus sp. LHW52908 TaxID=2303986 RepID=UPI000E3BDBD2|nr:ferredoxin--NADP reductase [Geodermatophilus sp. LHW52908]RFU20523.1 3-ketosteroid-9-alpha-hydroxylase [Geodermatophilus sp. LHW52908]